MNEIIFNASYYHLSEDMYMSFANLPHHGIHGTSHITAAVAPSSSNLFGTWSKNLSNVSIFSFTFITFIVV